MTHKELAMDLIQKNEEVIKERLFEDGYMFDDELVVETNYIPSPVARELSSCIEKHFQLEKEQYVIREEIKSEERSNGVFYFSECEISISELREIAKRHYKMK